MKQEQITQRRNEHELVPTYQLTGYQAENFYHDVVEGSNWHPQGVDLKVQHVENLSDGSTRIRPLTITFTVAEWHAFIDDAEKIREFVDAGWTPESVDALYRTGLANGHIVADGEGLAVRLAGEHATVAGGGRSYNIKRELNDFIYQYQLAIGRLEEKALQAAEAAEEAAEGNKP